MLRSQPRDRLVVTRFGSESKGLVNLILFQFQLSRKWAPRSYAKSATPSPSFCCPFILASPQGPGEEGWKGVHVFAAWEPCLLPPAGAARDGVGPLHRFLQPLLHSPKSTNIVRLNKSGLPAMSGLLCPLVKLTCHFSSC